MELKFGFKMPNTPQSYEDAMREVIRQVQRGELSGIVGGMFGDSGESEIVADCIRRGYINGTLEDSNGKEFRTMDGMVHPRIYNSYIPLKGLYFLQPDETKRQAKRASVRSWIAVIISLFAFFGAVLADLDRIMQNISLLQGLF